MPGGCGERGSAGRIRRELISSGARYGMYPELMVHGESEFKELWLGWKAGAPPPGDLDWQAKVDGFMAVLRSVTGRGSPSAHADAEKFVRGCRS